jgi:hypothetical protein
LPGGPGVLDEPTDPLRDVWCGRIAPAVENTE